MQNLVSIIMNCHDGEIYLNESIESVINQTYKNWELIFYDNHSKDNSAQIIKKYNDKRIKYFYSKAFKFRFGKKKSFKQGKG